ncbi:MAG: heme-binding protein, partial [Betaproteobacteria bacterium]
MQRLRQRGRTFFWPKFTFALVLVFTVTGGDAADLSKTLRVVLTIAETSFDPQFASDAASDGVIENIYEAMLDYDYLARPVKVVPRTLEAMPVIEDGGMTYICRVRKGIFFTPDPAFKGKPRELTAGDYSYAIKRLLDPAVKSPWIWLVEGKIAGSAEAIAKAANTGRFDYDAALPGLEVVDRYTLKIRLSQPDLRFIYALAVSNVAAVAREVVDAYGADFGAHPVGTGPYILGSYQRSSKIMLDANPGFREWSYTPSGPIPVESQAIALALKGRRLPFAGHIEISVIEEWQAR